MHDLYKTISSESKGLFKDRGSRFIALAYPVSSELEIKDRISLLRKEFHDARHHCFAWRLGPEMERYRVNDDGEPSGSAGRPIFGQIQSRELTDILIVVIRYFGGTLLGVGGLINAYRSSASDALEHAKVIEKKVEEKVTINFPYDAMNAVMSIIKEYELQMEKQHFDLDCSIELRVWSRNFPKLTQRLNKLNGCKMIIRE